MAVRYLNASGTQSLINEVKAHLATKASTTTTDLLQQQLTQVIQSIPTKMSELENDSGFMTESSADEKYYSQTAATLLTQTVQQQGQAISLLNADESTEGSVDYKIAQAIAGVGVESIPIADIDSLFD